MSAPFVPAIDDELDELDMPCMFCDELLRDCRCLDAEPSCTCQQVDVDRFDASDCDLCNPNSRWNEQRRREEAHYAAYAAWRSEAMQRNETDRAEPKPVNSETRVTEEAA
jgi:hypothetical protein